MLRKIFRVYIALSLILITLVAFGTSEFVSHAQNSPAHRTERKIESQQAPSGPLAATSLIAGDVAVIGYNTSMHDGTGHPDLIDKIYIVILKDIGSGTTFFLTDKTWNGSAFSTSGTDGAYTYTAGSAMNAGTVITLTSSDFGGAGVDFDFVTGEAVYIYQGSNASTPTSFLYALEAGDGNSTFNASLANTGLSVANGTAAAISFDSGAYAGPTTYAGSFLFNGASQPLLKSIADPTNWTGADQTGQNAIEQHVQKGPWLVAADMDMWNATVLGGGGLVHVSEDHLVNSGGTSFNTSDLYNNLIVGGTSFFWHLSDMVFDTVDGKFFVVDSDLGGGHNRIMQGNIADLLGNPGTAPTMITLYSDPSTAVDATNRLDDLDVDVANHIVYFTHAGDLLKVVYNTPNQAGTVLFRSDVSNATSPSGQGNPVGSTSNFFNDMVIDFITGHVYLSSTRVGASASGDIIAKNYIYDLSGLTSASGNNAFTFASSGGVYSNTGTARLLPFAQNDANFDPIAGTSASTHSTPAQAQPYFFPKERGSLDGLALDPTNHILYFSTGEILFDHDANTGTAPVYVGGVVSSYALLGNATGAVTILFQQPAQSSGAIPGLMGDLEIDTVTGKYYVTDYTGASGTDGFDQFIWSGPLGVPATPTQFASDINSIDSLTTVGMTINHAPALSGTGLAPAITEANSAPGSGETTRAAVFSGVTISDPDTTTADEISGAVVRISSGLLTGATHQDQLGINGTTSGTIAGSGIAYTYDSNTGAMVLTGAATVAEYKAAIELVTFSTNGDDITAFGTDSSRTISAAVSDGLSISDEIITSVTVTGINDAPVNALPTAAHAMNEDTANLAVSTNGVGNFLSVNDADANPAGQNTQMTLAAANGVITIRTDVVGGITAANITAGANGTSTITFTATQNQINTTLAASGALLYTPVANFFGTEQLTVTTNDLGSNGTDPGLTGTATSEQDQDVISITVNPVNDIPSFTKGADQTALAGSGAKTVSGWATNMSAGPADESAQVLHFNARNNNNSLFSVQPAIDASGQLTYTPAAGVSGSATVTVTIQDNGGTSNGGVDTSASQTFVINVTNTAVWSGAVSSDWNTAGNWTLGSVPIASNSVMVPSTGVTNQPNLSATDVTVANLTLSTGDSLTVAGSHTLTVNGNLAMNGNNIDATNGLLSITGTGSITRTSGLILGTLQKAFSAPQSFTYPVGTTGAYSPVDVTVTAGAGDLSIKANSGTAPAVPALDAIHMLQRYWSLSGTGITSNVTFHYLGAAPPAGDVPATSTEAQYNVYRIIGGTTALKFVPDGTNVVLNAAGDSFTVNSLSSYSDWTAGDPLAPTAANARIRGRVVNIDGRPVYLARVTIFGQDGQTFSAMTNPFGYFNIGGVEVGHTYLMNVRHKQYRFADRTISVLDNISDLDITALP